MPKYLFFFVLALGPCAFATEGLFTNIHSSFQSPRALGMGGAFVAVADDYATLFYNPAGLATLTEGQLNTALSVGLSASFLKFSKDVSEAGKAGTETEKTTKIAQLLQDNYGKDYSFRAGLLEGIWVRPGWGFGILPAQLSVDLSIHNQGAPAVNARLINDTTLAFGQGFDVKDETLPGRLSWGYTAKVVHRGYFSQSLNTLDLVADPNVTSSSKLQWGLGGDADLGLLFTPYIPDDRWYSFLHYARPTFGLVARNLLELGFQKSPLLKSNVADEKPPKNNRVLDLGSKWEYPSLWIFRGRGVLDIRDIGHPNFSLRKGFHGGLEFDWTLSSWWKGQYRIGVNQGYPTLGASALFTVFRLDVVTYGEDVGSYNSPTENRIYMAKFNLDF